MSNTEDKEISNKNEYLVGLILPPAVFGAHLFVFIFNTHISDALIVASEYVCAPKSDCHFVALLSDIRYSALSALASLVFGLLFWRLGQRDSFRSIIISILAMVTCSVVFVYSDAILHDETWFESYLRLSWMAQFLFDICVAYAFYSACVAVGKIKAQLFEKQHD